jgi:hypothetical protein
MCGAAMALEASSRRQFCGDSCRSLYWRKQRGWQVGAALREIEELAAKIRRTLGLEEG